MWSFAFCLLLLVVACDHRPPKQQVLPAPAAASASPAADAGVPTDGMIIVIRPDAAPVNDACLQIGVKLAEIIIAATTDPTQKAAYEQERTKLVKRFSENCQRENWPAPTRACFMAAKSSADVELCSRDLAKPAPPAPTPGSAGSAVDPHAGNVH